MTGDKGHTGSVVAVRKGYSGIGRHRDGRSHPGHNFEGNPGSDQFLGFLTASPEDKRITTLEAHHHMVPSLFHQQPVDVALAHGVIAAFLAHIDPFGLGRSKGEELLVGQIIIDDHFGPLEQRLAL